MEHSDKTKKFLSEKSKGNKNTIGKRIPKRNLLGNKNGAGTRSKEAKNNMSLAARNRKYKISEECVRRKIILDYIESNGPATKEEILKLFNGLKSNIPYSLAGLRGLKKIVSVGKRGDSKWALIK